MRRTVAAIALVALTGCSLLVSGEGEKKDNPAALNGPTPPTAAAAAAVEDPLSKAIADQENYVYNPIGKRDPFRSFLNFTRRDDRNSERLGPLQKYEIDQYHLVGIIWGIDRPRALVQDPSDTGHVAEIGTYIGKNWGKVTQITQAEVVVTEEYQTIDGELVVNNINLTLPVGEDDDEGD